MNPTAQYLKWVKDTYPLVFAAAVKKAKARNTLGGLGDDLTSDITFDPNTVTVDPSVSDAVDQATQSAATADAWGGFFSSLTNAISTVAPQIVQTKADLATIQANQQRAAQGLSIRPNLLTGAAGSMGSMAVIAAVLVGGFFLIGARRR